MAFWDFLTGTPEKRENVSLLRPYQEGLHRQSVRAAQNSGAGGAFGDTADYYRNNLSDNSADFNSFAAPELRQFNEQTIPGLSEQFAGMGSGGLSSSGFRNAAVNAGTDLSERLGAIRANLRQQSAQGLANIGQQGLQSYSQNMVTQPGSEGLLSNLSPAIGSAIGSFAGPIGTAVGGALGGAAGNLFKNSFGQNKVGTNSSPYGNSQKSGGFSSSLPSFNSSMRGF